MGKEGNLLRCEECGKEVYSDARERECAWCGKHMFFVCKRGGKLDL